MTVDRPIDDPNEVVAYCQNCGTNTAHVRDISNARETRDRVLYTVTLRCKRCNNSCEPFETSRPRRGAEGGR